MAEGGGHTPEDPPVKAGQGGREGGRVGKSGASRPLPRPGVCYTHYFVWKSWGLDTHPPGSTLPSLPSLPSLSPAPLPRSARGGATMLHL